MFVINEKAQHEVEVFKGVTRHTLACGKDILMARFEYKEGSKVPPHKHAYEQVTTVLEGEQKIIIRSEDETEEIVIKKGDTYVVPANFEHEQITLKEAVTIDAWSLAP
ncbi:MAG: cupin domain-containing protein [Candidatus Aminicenantes bacterium]|nr:cupin domain-containing protein [Candidatus Aminicenantes bacterium]